MDKNAALVMKITTAVVLVVAVLVGVYYGKSYFAEGNKVAEMLENGNMYMDASDYVKAITSFEEALSYEPESVEIRNAISYAYVMLAKTYGSSNEAIDAFQKSLMYNISNKAAYWGVANIYEELGDETNMMIALNTGYENTSDETMKAKIDAIEAEKARIQAEEEARAAEEAERAAMEAERAKTLEQLYALFEVDDMDAVKEMIRTEEFVDFADEVIGENNSFYYGTRTPDGLREGKGIAVYEHGYYYYGDFASDMRSGHGIYIRAVYSESSALGSFVYDGEWSNDKPNGNGTCTSNYYKDKIGASGLSQQIISGSYTDGLENGAMTLTGTAKTGTKVSYSYTAENGVAKKLSDEASGVQGQYIVAKSSDGKSNLTSDGSLRGVEGYIESEE